MSNKQVKYFRNKQDLESIEKIDVDASSLWKLDPKQNVLVLEDDDQYVTANLDLSKFEET